MIELPLPIYDENVDRYIVPKDHTAEVRYIKENVKLISIDTETYYDPMLRGVVRFVEGSPNNRPFCVTITYDCNDSELRSIYVDAEHIPEYADIIEDHDIAKILHNAKQFGVVKLLS